MANSRELSQFGRLVEIKDGTHIGIGTQSDVAIGFGTITAIQVGDSNTVYYGDGSNLTGISAGAGAASTAHINAESLRVGFSTFRERVVFDEILEFRGLEIGGANSLDWYDSSAVLQHSIIYNGEHLDIGGGDNIKIDSTGVGTVFITNAGVPVAAFTENTVKFYNALTETETLRIDPNNNVDIPGALNVSGVSTFSGDVTFDGATAGRDITFDRSNNALEFEDNAKAIFGSGSDNLSIYHNGANSYIVNDGSDSGSIYIRVTKDNERVHIQSDNGSGGLADYFAAYGNTGEARLYHYGNQKLATKSAGITVTGTINGHTIPSGSGTFALTSDVPTNNNQLTNGAGYITGYTVTESDVTTHQAALSITESQISDLGTYLTSSDLSSYATTSYVDTEVASIVDSAPGTLNTLNELAAALGDDANFSTTVTNSIAAKMPLAGGTFTGNVEFNDDVKARFGTGNDLDIYHSGSSGLMVNKTGALYLLNFANDQDIVLMSDNGAGGSTNYAVADGSTGEFKLYHYGDQRLATKSTGVEVTGDANVTGNVNSSSDASLKENIVPIDDALNKVLAMTGVEYDRIDMDGVHQIGVIAQEIEKVIPELVTENETTGLKSVSYGNITAVLIEAIKQQQEQINILRNKLNEL